MYTAWDRSRRISEKDLGYNHVLAIIRPPTHDLKSAFYLMFIAIMNSTHAELADS